MLVLHVDYAGFSGEGPLWEKVLNHVRQNFTLGKEEYDQFTVLGRQFQQNSDFTIILRQTASVNSFERVFIPKGRRASSEDELTDK